MYYLFLFKLKRACQAEFDFVFYSLRFDCCLWSISDDCSHCFWPFNWPCCMGMGTLYVYVCMYDVYAYVLV